MFLAQVLQGQPTNYIAAQFDTDTTANFNYEFGHTVSAWSWNTNYNALTANGPNNPGSGCAEISEGWTNTGSQFELGYRIAPNSDPLDISKFNEFSCDVMFGTNSATDGNGSYGKLIVGFLAFGNATTMDGFGNYTFYVSNGNGWIHLSFPIQAGTNADYTKALQLAFKIQQEGTGNNLAGTTHFYLDNMIFSGYTMPVVTGPPQIIQLNTAQLWQMLQFQITNAPVDGNPFDPDSIRLDATFTLPSGGAMMVPAFWYQGYTRMFSGSAEYDVVSGPPQWRLRFTPPEAGDYSLSLAIETNDQPYTTIVTNFTVVSNALPARFGYVGIAPNHQYFQTGDGQALPLNGENVALPSSEGTYDYDNWFASMQQAGENFARVWMSPGSFGIESAPGTLTNYDLDAAWQLDYVLQLAEQEGIYVQLTLDDYREYATNVTWSTNPYNSANGGPCLSPNGFFTNTMAEVLYQKRLRYVIARYGYSQNLLAWELFNEIENDYSVLNTNNVLAWHVAMADWLHTNDPYHHLVTSSSDPTLAALPQLDFGSEHSYDASQPTGFLAETAQYFLDTYGKPIMIGEFGTDGTSWANTMAGDPYLRGFRQGLWGGALGGSVGTAMPWWWVNIAEANDYWPFSALNTILGRTDWGRGNWTNIVFQSGQPWTAIGQQGANDSLVYVVATNAVWYFSGGSSATNASLPLQQGQNLILENWPSGTYYAEWYSPTNGLPVGSSQATTANGKLTLSLPDYTVDLAGIIYPPPGYPPPTLTMPNMNQNGSFQFQLNCEVGGVYAIEKSSNLLNWMPFLNVTNVQGTMNVVDPQAFTNPAAFYRARKL